MPDTKSELKEGETEKKNLLQKIVEGTLEGIQGEDTKTLQSLLKNQGLIPNPEKVPAHLSFNKNDRSLSNIVKGVIKGTDLEDLTEGELKRIVQGMGSDPQDVVPEHYVKSPLEFGGVELGQKDLEIWRGHKKDVKETLTIEEGLNYVNKYHEKNGKKFSESSLIEYLHIALPNKVANFLNTLRNQKATLKEIYTQLCFRFGSAKSKTEVRDALFKITSSSNKNIMEVLGHIFELTNNISSSIEEVDETCIQEARRYLKSVGAFQILATIECMFLLSKNRTYAEFYRIAKTYFEEELSSKKRIHHVEEEREEKINLKQELSQVIHELKLNNQGDKQGEKAKEKSGEKACFECGKTNHLVKDCFQRKNKKGSSKSQPTQMGYNKMTCVIHKGGHSNEKCLAQKVPCTFRSTHGGHTQGDCRRTQMTTGVAGQYIPPPNFVYPPGGNIPPGPLAGVLGMKAQNQPNYQGTGGNGNWTNGGGVQNPPQQSMNNHIQMDSDMGLKILQSVKQIMGE